MKVCDVAVWRAGELKNLLLPINEPYSVDQVLNAWNDWRQLNIGGADPPPIILLGVNEYHIGQMQVNWQIMFLQNDEIVMLMVHIPLT